jgi:hypothetical protein
MNLSDAYSGSPSLRRFFPGARQRERQVVLVRFPQPSRVDGGTLIGGRLFNQLGNGSRPTDPAAVDATVGRGITLADLTFLTRADRSNIRDRSVDDVLQSRNPIVLESRV